MPPIVPGIQENQRLDQRSPTQAESVDDAGLGSRIRAQGYNQLQGEMLDTLKIADAYEKKRRDLAKKLSVSNFREDAEKAALEMNDKALRDSAADGSDITKIFNDQYDEYYKNQLSQVTDPDAKREARAEAINVRNAMNKTLFEQGRAKFVTYGQETSRRMQKQASAGVLANPDEASLYVDRGYQAIKRVEPMLGKDNAYKETIAFEKEFADSHIQGYVQQGRYDEARKSLLEKHASAFDSKERREKLDYIDQKQLNDLTRKRGDIRWDQDQSKLMLEKTQEQNFGKLYAAQVAGQNIEPEMQDLFSKGMLSSAHATILEKGDDKVDQLTSDGTYYNFVGRAIVLQQPVNDLLIGVAQARKDGTIKPEKAAELTNWLYNFDKTKKDKKFSDPAFNEKRKANDKVLRARFGVSDNPFAFQFNAGDNAKLYAAANQQYVNLVYFQGVGQDAALKEVLKTKGGTVDIQQDVPAIPGLDRGSYSDPQAILGAKKSLKKKYEKGDMSIDDLLSHMRSLKKLEGVNENKSRWQDALEETK